MELYYFININYNLRTNKWIIIYLETNNSVCPLRCDKLYFLVEWDYLAYIQLGKIMGTLQSLQCLNNQS
jgi:hypothetical protein